MENILKINDLVINYETDDGIVEAVNNLNLKLNKGDTLGIVGETGAGKTTLARGIMGLIPKPPGKIKSGEIIYDGKNLLGFSETEMRKIRGKEISMIFQDPMTSLNPVMTVGDQISEVIQNHENISLSDADKKACDMLELVGIPKDRSKEYPHQFSGGMKQRVIIAIALACNPNLLIADEPTTALDVTIQAQVLSMMKNLKTKFNMSMILITHDLGVVAQTCDYVAIMYAGEIVEYGKIGDIFKNTSHPYTKGLFGSIPNLIEDVKRLKPIEGSIPDPTNLPKGCSFSTRCKYATNLCKTQKPETSKITDTHEVRCFINEGKVKLEVL
jgi:peptide/nickel transport system ATP-binding protein